MYWGYIAKGGVSVQKKRGVKIHENERRMDCRTHIVVLSRRFHLLGGILTRIGVWVKDMSPIARRNEMWEGSIPADKVFARSSLAFMVVGKEGLSMWLRRKMKNGSKRAKAQFPLVCHNWAGL
jgi:hypothetical protein